MARLSKGNVLGPEKPGGPSRPDPESPWAKANAAKMKKMGIPGKGVAKPPTGVMPKLDKIINGWEDLQRSTGTELLANMRKAIADRIFPDDSYYKGKLSYLESTTKSISQLIDILKSAPWEISGGDSRFINSTDEQRYSNLTRLLSTYRANVYDLEATFLRKAPNPYGLAGMMRKKL